MCQRVSWCVSFVYRGIMLFRQMRRRRVTKNDELIVCFVSLFVHISVRETRKCHNRIIGRFAIRQNLMTRTLLYIAHHKPIPTERDDNRRKNTQKVVEHDRSSYKKTSVFSVQSILSFEWSRVFFLSVSPILISAFNSDYYCDFIDCRAAAAPAIAANESMNEWELFCRQRMAWGRGMASSICARFLLLRNKIDTWPAIHNRGYDCQLAAACHNRHRMCTWNYRTPLDISKLWVAEQWVISWQFDQTNEPNIAHLAHTRRT